MNDAQTIADITWNFPNGWKPDWADSKAIEITESFMAIDGRENWHLPEFYWYSLNQMIARALREERGRD